MKKKLAALTAAVALTAAAMFPGTASAASICTHDIYYSPDGWVYRFLNHWQRGDNHMHLVFVNRANQPGSGGFYATFVCNFA